MQATDKDWNTDLSAVTEEEPVMITLLAPRINHTDRRWVCEARRTFNESGDPIWAAAEDLEYPDDLEANGDRVLAWQPKPTPYLGDPA